MQYIKSGCQKELFLFNSQKLYIYFFANKIECAAWRKIEFVIKLICNRPKNSISSEIFMGIEIFFIAQNYIDMK